MPTHHYLILNLKNSSYQSAKTFFKKPFLISYGQNISILRDSKFQYQIIRTPYPENFLFKLKGLIN